MTEKKLSSFFGRKFPNKFSAPKFSKKMSSTGEITSEKTTNAAKSDRYPHEKDPLELRKTPSSPTESRHSINPEEIVRAASFHTIHHSSHSRRDLRATNSEKFTVPSGRKRGGTIEPRKMTRNFDSHPGSHHDFGTEETDRREAHNVRWSERNHRAAAGYNRPELDQHYRYDRYQDYDRYPVQNPYDNFRRPYDNHHHYAEDNMYFNNQFRGSGYAGAGHCEECVYYLGGTEPYVLDDSLLPNSFSFGGNHFSDAYRGFDSYAPSPFQERTVCSPPRPHPRGFHYEPPLRGGPVRYGGEFIDSYPRYDYGRGYIKKGRFCLSSMLPPYERYKGPRHPPYGGYHGPRF